MPSPLRPAFLAAFAAGPVCWLLLPGVVAPDRMPGAPTAGIYPLLHRWWATGSTPALHFPDSGALPADTLGTLVHPLVVVLGAPVVVKLVMLAGTLASLVVAYKVASRVLGDAWAAAAAAAAFTASPAVVAGATNGEVDAWQGWALLALPLCGGPVALGVGALVGVIAPTLVPAALLPALLVAWAREGRERWFPLAGWGVAVVLRSALGWPDVESAPSTYAWFAALTPAPAPERVYEVYVGFAAAALLLLGFAGEERSARGWSVVGALALVGALVQAPVPPERFLLLVPFAAAVGGLAFVRAHAAGWLPAASVWTATLLIGEGWHGQGVALPLATAPLAAPAPVDQLVDGPVLDLPATRGAIRRGLWYQSMHEHAIAPDGDGLVTAEVADAASALSSGTCVDVAALGFRNVVARREGVLRELGGLRTCFGDPAWDDGVVAVWHVGVKSLP